MSICAALLQIAALTLWVAAAVPASAGEMKSGVPTTVGDVSQAGTADIPCPMGEAADCPAGCCHHHHCDDPVDCLTAATGPAAIVPCASMTERLGMHAGASRFPGIHQVRVGRSIPPPARPPND